MKRCNSRFLVLLVVVLFTFSCNLGVGGGGNEPIATVADASFLGRGYNLVGNYADSLEVKAAVLDFNALKAAGLVEQVKLEQSSFTTVEGKTLDEYQSNLSEKVSLGGSYEGFSGSVAVNFSQSRYQDAECSFATVQSIISKYSARINLGTDAATLKNYLTADAKAAINNADLAPADLFATYGTHVLRGIVIGGRLDYSTSANMSKVATTSSIGVLAKAAFDKYIEASSDTQVSDELTSFRSACDTTLKVYGGSSEYGQYITNADASDYSPWINSISANPVFCDFDNTTPLIPLWDFCDSPIRAKQLSDGFTSYINAHAITQSLKGGTLNLKAYYLFCTKSLDTPAGEDFRCSIEYEVDSSGNVVNLASVGDKTLWDFAIGPMFYDFKNNTSTTEPALSDCVTAVVPLPRGQSHTIRLHISVSGRIWGIWGTCGDQSYTYTYTPATDTWAGNGISFGVEQPRDTDTGSDFSNHGTAVVKFGFTWN